MTYPSVPSASAGRGRRRAATLQPLLALTLSLLGVACAERERLTLPDEEPVAWEIGAIAEYPVSADPGTIVSDAATGAEFRFPSGGAGTLRVAPILSGPVAPYAGQGVWVDYAGSQEVQLLADLPAAGRAYVFGYGTIEGAVNEPAAASRWVSVPQVDTLESRIACLLMLPAGGKIDHASSPTLVHPQASAPGGFDKYWISSIQPGAATIDSMLNIELQASTYIDAWLATLTPARRTLAESEVRGRLSVHYAFDGLYYSGFWFRSLGAYGRRVHPTLHFRTTVNAGNVAHELGHYFTHVLAGDDTWSVLEGQAPLWDTGHGIRDVVGRGVVLEEYAYVGEFHLFGNVKGYDLFEPYVVFKDMTPLGTDYPGVEGFGAVMLASLARSSDQVRDLITGIPVPAPVVDLPWSDIYEIIALGATDNDALRGRIETRLGAEADRLPALLQRCGWRYSVGGRYVDAAGAGVPGVTTTAVSRVDGTTYTGGTTTMPSASDGKFAVVGGVFGGDSELRAVKGPDTTYVAIQIDWAQPTSTRQELGNLVVSFPPVITQLSPASGAPGSAVTISGRSFGATQGGGSVSFAGTLATVTSWSDASIAATVPSGAHSGPVTVTRNGSTSNGSEFTVTGVGHWELLEIEESDWPATTSQWCSSAQMSSDASSFSVNCGYDNPNFTEPHWLDWETQIEGSWTVPPTELYPGDVLSITLTLSTTIVRADDPPTRSSESNGWIYIDAWGTFPPTLAGSGSQTTQHTVPMVGYDPVNERLALLVTGGGYTGRVYRQYMYRWEQ